jgi:serine/threonine protein kinase
VPVFEADDNGGQPYLVFEYVDGGTLAEARRSKRPAACPRGRELLLGVLDALAEAHEQGIVHRDLKPSNILLGRDGRARVMDFGIAARAPPTGGRPTAASSARPGYMSPEAARGEAPVPAMDVFAAGVMLGELLCGAPLLRERDPMRAVQRVQVEDLVLPANVRRSTTALRGIVQRALARDPRSATTARVHARRAAAWLNPQGRVRRPPNRQQRHAWHAGLPAAPHAPQVRLSGAVGIGGAHPAPGGVRHRKPGQPVRRDPA